MRIASLRLGLVLLTFVALPHVTAAPRFWTLTGVKFSDGAIATGTFSYDDATQTIANWNVRVSRGPVLFAFTYVPGNSGAHTYLNQSATQPTLIFVSAPGGPPIPDSARFLSITPLTSLDGNNASTSVNLSCSLAVEQFGADESRCITAGSLVFTSLEPSVSIVQIDEFYNVALGHYFITADAGEKQDLDGRVHSGWMRTGQSFKAYATGSAGGSISNSPLAIGLRDPVCRYYGDPLHGLDSHFYSADAAECVRVDLYQSDWLFESDNVFQIDLPDVSTGACRSGTIPVYRLWNQRGDSNHRYTTNLAIRAEMLAAGYIAEGYGPDGVAMCALE